MPRRRRLVWLMLAVLAAALLWPPSQARVSVVGDGAAAVKAALEALAPGRAAVGAAVGAVDAILLRRAETLRNVPDAQRLCRGRCGPGLTVLYEVRPGGGRKLLVFELSGVDGIAALDRGDPMPTAIAACVARIVAAEAAALRPAADPCLPQRRFRVVLPFGL